MPCQPGSHALRPPWFTVAGGRRSRPGRLIAPASHAPQIAGLTLRQRRC